MNVAPQLDSDLFINLMPEIKYVILQHLEIRDICRCSLVSKNWNAFFNSDFVWIFMARKLNIKKLETTSYFQYFFNWFSKQSVKSLVHQQLSIQKQDNISDIGKKYPKEFLKIFGSAKAIYQLPSLELNLKEVREFPSLELFSTPIRRVILKMDKITEYYILLRIKNNETGQIYCEHLGIFNWYSTHTIHVIAPAFSERVIFHTYGYLTDDRLKRVQRLINRLPVGLIVSQTPESIQEGPRITSQGKSLLELC